MTETMNVEQVEAKLKELIAGQEDYVYERTEVGCANWTYEDGKRVGSCLVGKFFESIIGLDVFDSEYQFWGSNAVVDEAGSLGLRIDDNGRRLLASVQDKQDTGTPWGDAVRIGRSEAEKSLGYAL